MRPAASLLVLALAGCFNPTFTPGFRCADQEPRCPAGLVCAFDGTCQTDSGQPPGANEDWVVITADSRPALAPFDDGAMLALRAHDSSGAWAEVKHLSATGALIGDEYWDAPALDDADVSSLKGAGSDTVAVFAAAKGEDVVFVWADGQAPVAGAHTGPRSSFTTFGSRSWACVATGVSPGVARRSILVTCKGGPPPPILTVDLGLGLKVRSLAGAVTERAQAPDVALAWEVDIADQVGKSALFVKCPTQAAPADVPLLIETPPPGGSLSPQLFFSGGDDFLALMYRTDQGASVRSIAIADCTLLSAEARFLDPAMRSAAIAGRGAVTGWSQPPEVWRLLVSGIDPSRVRAGQAYPDPDEVFAIDEAGFAGPPLGVTDGNSLPLFFYHTGEAAGPGVVHAIEATGAAGWGPPVRASRDTVFPDFAVAPRRAGGAFVAYRDGSGGHPESPADLYVRTLGPDGRFIPQ
jgi:hypothetical protein